MNSLKIETFNSPHRQKEIDSTKCNCCGNKYNKHGQYIDFTMDSLKQSFVATESDVIGELVFFATIWIIISIGRIYRRLLLSKLCIKCVEHVF